MVRDLVPIQSRVVAALPRHQHRKGLYVLNGELQDQRRRAKGARVEVDEDEAPQLGWLVAPQSLRLARLWRRLLLLLLAVSALCRSGLAHQFSVVPQPLPEFLRVAVAVQRVFCKVTMVIFATQKSQFVDQSLTKTCEEFFILLKL